MAIDKLTEFSSSNPTTNNNTVGLTLADGFPKSIQPARQWMNWLFNSLTKKINEIIDGMSTSGDNSIGLISICPFATIPSDRMGCEGQTLNIADYPKLYAKIGIIYGGDGVTTFMLPDLRGEFLRGLDDGRGVDVGRVLGSHQGDAIRNITGTARYFPDRLSGATGVFGVTQGTNSSGTGTGNGDSVLTFDASKQVPTANENRPRNVAMIFVIKVM